jgi:Uma2 family endonuclease
MSAVSIAEAWPAPGQPFTVDDLDRMPDDGRRYELLNGVLSDDTEFDPDVVVVRWEDVGGAKITAPPLLVAEIRSPGTALIDLNRKKTAYRELGVQCYWIVDPDPEQPWITAFGLQDGEHTTLAEVIGLEMLDAEQPFPVEVVPALLLAGLPSQNR